MTQPRELFDQGDAFDLSERSKREQQQADREAERAIMAEGDPEFYNRPPSWWRPPVSQED